MHRNDAEETWGAWQMFAVEMTLKKNLAKRGVWQMFSFIFNLLK